MTGVRLSSNSTSFPLLRVSVAGILGGIVGFIAGMLFGAITCDWNIKEAGCVEDAAIAAIIGSSVVMLAALLVAAGNLRTILTSALMLVAVLGIGAAGTTAAFATGLGGLLIATPFLQFTGVIGVLYWQTRVNRKPLAS